MVDKVAHMPSQRTIVKIGLAVMHDNRLLLVRKKGGQSYILPGGKPEEGEDDRQALFREIDEELGCAIDPHTLVFLGAFSDVAADLRDTTVVVRLYGAKLVGAPSPKSEIESLTWFAPEEEQVTLAPSIQNRILPFLQSAGHLTQAS
jgi:8-oxo-dGTP diphosphatase